MFESPMPCLRQKYMFEVCSELKLFNSLPLNDVWSDAKLIDCYLYLWGNKNLHIPAEWLESMKSFTSDLRKAPRLVQFL